MRWKDNVVIKKKHNIYTLTLEGRETQIHPEHIYILEAIQKGLEDDEELVAYIGKKEGISEAAAGFTMAGFLVEYADYVAEDHSYMEIV